MWLALDGVAEPVLVLCDKGTAREDGVTLRGELGVDVGSRLQVAVGLNRRLLAGLRMFGPND